VLLTPQGCLQFDLGHALGCLLKGMVWNLTVDHAECVQEAQKQETAHTSFFSSILGMRGGKSGEREKVRPACCCSSASIFLQSSMQESAVWQVNVGPATSHLRPLSDLTGT